LLGRITTTSPGRTTTYFFIPSKLTLIGRQGQVSIKNSRQRFLDIHAEKDQVRMSQVQGSERGIENDEPSAFLLSPEKSQDCTPE
jgi:hypothetical protein